MDASRDHAEHGYLVVARRYRPQSFDELLGQDQATRALKNAIQTNRVGHAYLFTGARGVGKTSAARIFSKSLNCQQGPTPSPCGQCDICQSITSGNDVDVLEIDGASNRGIDEIRQLRSNVNVRPGRARFKIYIIDEVHMLTKEAFNALLKTLEEPPAHVKFIFCTTDPEKIPITVLSRCQRFDFLPVSRSAIVHRLREIVATEGADADLEALELLARRAAGSLRDSQSLLEQLLAFGGTQITVADVHALLGTADVSRVLQLTSALVQRDAGKALELLDAAVESGVDVGQLAEQLLGMLRDIMAAGVGAAAEMLRHAPAGEWEKLRGWAEAWGLPTLLAAVQIVDQSLTRMRQSLDRRTSLETALVRVAMLENLSDLSQLAQQIGHATLAGTPTVAPAAPIASGPAGKKKVDAAHPPVSTPASTATQEPAAMGIASLELTPHSATAVWNTVVDQLPGIDSHVARSYSQVTLGENGSLTIDFPSALHVARCRRPEAKQQMESLLRQVTGRQVRLDFAVSAARQAEVADTPRRKSQQVLMREALDHGLVKEAMDLFQADIRRVVDGQPLALPAAGPPDRRGPHFSSEV